MGPEGNDHGLTARGLKPKPRHEFLELTYTLGDPLLMLQQHRHHDRLKRLRSGEIHAGLHVQLRTVKQVVIDGLGGFCQHMPEPRSLALMTGLLGESRWAKA